MAQQEQASVDYEAVTGVMQQIWSKGDFAYVAPVVQFVADQLVESVDVLPGDRVLVELSPYDLTRGRITYRFR